MLVDEHDAAHLGGKLVAHGSHQVFHLGLVARHDHLLPLLQACLELACQQLKVCREQRDVLSVGISVYLMCVLLLVVVVKARE